MLRLRYDAGHAWLEVPRQEVVRTGITVTPWSYQHRDKVYLEEDRDAVTYLTYRAAEIGVPLKELAKYVIIEPVDDGDESPIRGYQNYSQNYKEDECQLNL